MSPCAIISILKFTIEVDTKLRRIGHVVDSGIADAEGVIENSQT